MVFEKYDTWREHPKLNFSKAIRSPRNWGLVWPGASWGIAAFVLYLGLEKVGVIPSSGGHHGNHGHGHDDKHH